MKFKDFLLFTIWGKVPPVTLIRLHGDDRMVRVPMALDHLRAILPVLGASSTPESMAAALDHARIPHEPTLALLGDETALVRVDPKKVLIRTPGPEYVGTWASAPVTEIIGEGAWKLGVDESLRALQALEDHVQTLRVDSPLRAAMLDILDAARATRR